MNVYGDIAPRTAGKAMPGFLMRALPYLVLEKYLDMKPLPSNSTKVAIFRRYEALEKAITPLVEGVTPVGKNMRYTDVQCTLQQFGDFVQLTDVIADTHEDPVLQEYIGITAEQAAQTLETLRYNVLKAGTNVFFANGTQRTDVNTALTLGAATQSHPCAEASERRLHHPANCIHPELRYRECPCQLHRPDSPRLRERRSRYGRVQGCRGLRFQGSC